MTSSRQRTIELIERHMTADDRSRSLAIAFGAAAACLAIILLIAQIGVGKTPLLTALIGAAVALPLWLGLGLSEQFWMLFKLGPRDLQAVEALRRIQQVAYWSAVALLVLSVGSLIYSLSPLAACLFAVSALLALAGFTVALGVAAVTALQKCQAAPDAATE
jgi:hypothetical protein